MTSILKKDFSDFINRKSYKIKPSLKNFRNRHLVTIFEFVTSNTPNLLFFL